MQSPESIPLGRLVKALAAFSEVVGLDPHQMYFPLHVDRDGITFSAAVLSDEGQKVRASGFRPGSVLAVPMHIKVV